jgi:hypothetical protein
MQADELPQQYIDSLAELLLELAEQSIPVDGCTRCGSDDVNHRYQGQPYCELCRGCYDTNKQEE